VHYQFGEQTTSATRARKNVGLNLMYSGGPLSLTAFYERAQISNPVSLAVMLTQEQLDGGRQLRLQRPSSMPFTGCGQDRRSGPREHHVLAGPGHPRQRHARHLHRSGCSHHPEVGSVSGTRTTVSLGYDHFCPSAPTFYAVAMYDRVSMDIPNKSGTSALVGIRHRF
jgi:predicted porin